MSDKTLASLTAATSATGGLIYGTQGGADRKFTLTAAGAAMMEATDAIKLDELAAPTDVTTLNATTSAHGLLPKLGGGTTNFLRADGSWAAPGGGPINLPLRAWVEMTGDDGTGTVGDPGKPYLTMLAAYTAGARMMHLGAGSFAGISKSGPIDLTYAGKGFDKTNIITISSTTGGNVVLRDVGYKSATIGTINTSYAGSDGSAGGPLTLHSVRAAEVTTAGMAGRAGDGDNTYGGDGGDGGDLTGSEIEITDNLNMRGGNGGLPFDDGSTIAGAGNAAQAGGITVTGRLRVGGILNMSGGIASNGLYGGPDGTPANGGSITADELFVGGALSMTAGGEDASPGNMTVFRAYIASADFGGSASNLSTVTGTFVVIPTASGGPVTGDLLLSHVNGSAIGTT